jgi:hypothetical protein
MSARIVPLDAFLLREVIAEPADPLAAEMASGPQFEARAMLIPGLSFAMIDGAFAVAACGLIPIFAGRAECWALLSRQVRPRHIVRGTRALKTFLDLRQRDPAFRRVEMTVVASNCWASSFAHALGFVREGLMRAYDPLARDHVLFARVKERF